MPLLPLALAVTLQTEFQPVLHPMNFDLPPAMVSKGSTRLVPLELGGRKNVHVVIGCSDDTMRFMINPGVHRDIIEDPISHTVYDFDALYASGRAIPQLWDDLILAQPAGLSFYGWRPSGAFTAPLDHGATYQNCEQVRVRDLDKDGLLDILVVLAGGTDIATKIQQNTGGFIDGPSFTPGGTIQDLDCLDFLDQAWGNQIVVNDSTGFEVFRQDVAGGPWISEAFLASQRPDLDAMTVVSDGYAASIDQLAFVTARTINAGSTEQVLFTWDQAGLHLQEIFDQSILAMDSHRCDVDLAGTHDLAMTSGEDGHVYFVYASGSPDPTQKYRLSDASTYSLDAQSTDNLATASRPLLVELNNDGWGIEENEFPDLVLAHQDVLVVDGPLEPAIDTSGQGVFSVDFPVGFTTNHDNQTSEVHTINPICWFDDIEAKKAAGWQLEMTQVHHVSGQVFATSDPDSHGYYDLSTYSFPYEEFQANFGVVNSLQGSPGDTTNLDDNAHYYTLRLVVLDASDNVVQSGPKLIGLFCQNATLRANLDVDQWKWGDRQMEDVASWTGSGQVFNSAHIRMRRGARLSSLVSEITLSATLNNPIWDSRGEP